MKFNTGVSRANGNAKIQVGLRSFFSACALKRIAVPLIIMAMNAVALGSWRDATVYLAQTSWNYDSQDVVSSYVQGSRFDFSAICSGHKEHSDNTDFSVKLATSIGRIEDELSGSARNDPGALFHLPIFQGLPPLQSGDYYQITCKMSSDLDGTVSRSYNFKVLPSGIDEEEALDLEYTRSYLSHHPFRSIEYSTEVSGKAEHWFGESAISFLGGSAMQSGICAPGGCTVLAMSGVGHPSRIRFKWAGVGASDDRLEFYKKWIRLGEDSKKLSATYKIDSYISANFVQSEDFIIGTNGWCHTYSPESVAWVFRRGTAPLNGEIHAGFVDDVDIKPLRKIVFVCHGGQSPTIDSIWVEPGERFDKWMALPGSPKRLPLSADGEIGQFAFVGWYDDYEVVQDPMGQIMYNGTGNLIVGGEIVPEGEYEGQPLRLHARWEYYGTHAPDNYDPKKHAKLVFKSNGGEVYPPEIYIGKGTSVKYLPTPEKEGYVFDGWSTGQTGGTRIDEGSVISDGMLLYARWIVDETTSPGGSSACTVTFVSEDKTLGTATVEKGKNTNQAAASAYKPTRAGYTLVGWYDQDGNVVFDAQGRAANGAYWNGSYSPGVSSATWKYVGSVTAYARWTPIPTYTVTLNANGGSVSGQSTVSFQVQSGKNTNQAGAKRTVARSGYMLAGWYDTSASSGGNMIFNASGYAVNGTYWNGTYVPNSSSATWKYAGNVTAYARWTPIPKYRVTFYGGGKTLGSAMMEMGRNTNQAAASTYKPTRSGYVLSGWYDKDGNVMFDAQGRAKNGKYWNGNYTRSSSGATLTSATWKYDGNVTAYAWWTLAPGMYEVTLDAHGGLVSGQTSVSMAVEKGKNTMQAGANRTVTQEGSLLVGWYDTYESSGGNMVFDARGFAVNGKYWNGSYSPNVSSATWKYAGSVTVYARWVLDRICAVVTFDANGGTIRDGTYVSVAQCGLYWSITNLASMTVRTGYVLSGWYDKDGNKMFDANGLPVQGIYWEKKQRAPSGKEWLGLRWNYTGNVTAYARWTPNSNANAAGGRALVESESLPSDDNLFAPGELAGRFADGDGTFALMLDKGLKTACLAAWTTRGDMLSECEAVVADETLILTTETGEVYRLAWDGGSLVATRVE